MDRRSLISIIGILVFIILSLLIRYSVAGIIPHAILYVESHGYELIAKDVIVNHSFLAAANPAHTPGYPLVLSTAGIVKGVETHSQSNGWYFSEGYEDLVVYFQTILTIIACIVFTTVLRVFRFPFLVIGLFILLLFSLPQIILLERMILSESLSSVWVLSICSIYLLLLRKKRSWVILLTGILLGILGWIIRPTFYYFVPLIALSIIFMKPKKQIIIFSLFFLFSSLLSGYFYGWYIGRTTGYHGITYISDLSYVGKVVEYGIPFPLSYPKNEMLLKGLTLFFKEDQKPRDVFTFINTQYLDVYSTPKLYEDFGAIGKISIREHLHLFLQKTIIHIPRVIFSPTDMDFYPYGVFRNNGIGSLYILLGEVFRTASLILYIAAPVSVLEGFFAKNMEKKIVGIFSFIIVLNSLFLILFATSDFDRYVAPFLPLILFVTIWWFHRIMSSILFPLLSFIRSGFWQKSNPY